MYWLYIQLVLETIFLYPQYSCKCYTINSVPLYCTHNVYTIHVTNLVSSHYVIQAKTPAERKQIVRNTGCRYSVLNSRSLPGFDPIENTIIDPMHTLFLGIAKKTTHLWIEKDTITAAQYNNIQKILNSIHVPRGITRIPSKISSGFSNLTADQWKIWTTLYSTYCLHAILPTEQMDMYVKFVKACCLMCSKVITEDLCQEATQHMVDYCTQFQSLFGSSACVPNMHFACHIPDCLRRFGPAQGLWLFSFERYNGILGEAQLNHKNITVQLMRHFLRISETEEKTENIPNDIQEVINLESTPLYKNKRISNSVQASLNPVVITTNRYYLQIGLTRHITDFCDSKYNSLLRTPVQSFLHDQELSQIEQLIANISSHSDVKVAKECSISKRCTYGEITYDSCESDSKCCYFYSIHDHQGVSVGKSIEFIQITVILDCHVTITISRVHWLR